MNNTTEPTDSWSPVYPRPKDAHVELSNDQFETFLSDRRPGISVINYPPLEKPACFWIDYEHVYLRTNWWSWSTVSLANPEQVAALCNAHVCQICYAADNKISTLVAPVYHIAELPKELFSDNADSDENDETEYHQSIYRIKQIIKAFDLDIQVFENVKLDDNIASVVLSNDEHAIIMYILPENRNFEFIPETGEENYEFIDKWPTDKIPLDFIGKLRNMAEVLSEKEPEATIDIGFLANTPTITDLRVMLADDEYSDLYKFSYEGLGFDLEEIYGVSEHSRNIADRVKQIIVEHMGVEAPKLQDDTSFVDDLEADDMDIVDLLMAFEEEFGCEIPCDDYVKIRTVKDAIDYIEKLTSEDDES